MKVNKLNREQSRVLRLASLSLHVLRTELVFKGYKTRKMSHDEMYLEANRHVRRMIVERRAPRAKATLYSVDEFVFATLSFSEARGAAVRQGSSCLLFNLINVFAFAQLFMPNCT
jgi:hypothetical protein